jgi:hypothetical protein
MRQKRKQLDLTIACFLNGLPLTYDSMALILSLFGPYMDPQCKNDFIGKGQKEQKGLSDEGFKRLR